MPEYRYFKVRHLEYNANLWAKCRAFYAGGESLLGDKKLLQQVFPRHLHEEDFVYDERVSRAYYIPYAGEIVDAIVAALFGEPLSVEIEPTPDPFYDEFFKDTSPPAGRKTPLNDLAKKQVLTALLCRKSWTLVDLPDVPPDVGAPASLADQEKAGTLDAYACALDPEMVLDWEETEDGELTWVLVLHVERKRDGLESTRNKVREEYTEYTADGWKRYFIEYKVGKPPQDTDDVALLDEGPLSFGRVPMVRLDLGEGLWCMGKIISIAIAHFNLRNALSWAELKSLFPLLAAYLGGEEVLNAATEDPNRALNQKYGQGRIAQFGEKDRLEYTTPDAAPYSIAMQDLNGLRDEMHRVLHHMALSVDNSAAALQRSGVSKQVDQAATAVILRAIGQLVRDHVEEVYEMVREGRGDKEWTSVAARGMEKFNEQAVEVLVEQATTVDAVSIPSATFKRRWCFQLARRLLGDNATEEDLEQIAEELEENIANEDFLPPIPTGAPPELEGGDEEEEEEEEKARVKVKVKAGALAKRQKELQKKAGAAA